MNNNDILPWLDYVQRRSLPHNLLAIATNENSISRLIDEINNETHLIRLNLIPELCQSHHSEASVLTALIQTSNTLHGYLLEQQHPPNADHKIQQLHYYYRSVLDIFELLVDWLEELPTSSDKKILEVVPVTNYKLSRTQAIFLTQLRELTVYLNRSAIDPALGTLVLDEFKRFITKKWLSVADVKYIAAFSDAFASRKPATTMELVFLLYQSNFNSAAFLAYCINHCSELVTRAPGLIEQLDVLCRVEDQVNILSNNGSQAWAPGNTSIDDRLQNFIADKKRFLRHQLKFRRLALRTPSIGETSERMFLNLSVAQFALVIRLFIVVGVLPSKEVGKTFSFFARHFYTKNAQFISSESLQRKSNDIELSTVTKMKSLLISKVNWLNKTFNS